MRGAGRRLRRALFALAIIVAFAVHQRFPWIPALYLAGLIGVPVVGWRLAHLPTAPRPVRWAAPVLAGATTVALCPVPWMRAELDRPPGNAWALDGRLVINGDIVDPPGDWYWLTVGRPPIVAEVVAGWISGSSRPMNMLGGRQAQRPAVVEPAAAAVGLRRAGWPIRLGLVVEVSDPLIDKLPARAVLAMINGTALTSREMWDRAVAGLHDRNTLTTADGRAYQFEGEAMPFGRVDLIDAPGEPLDVAVGGRLASTLPGSWFRDLSLGSSHGLMVALVSYVHGSGDDLARGRAIAGTGRIRGDGSVGRIGGLVAKATAARQIGADVLLFPTSQLAELEGFDPGSMRLIPVISLDEAIAALGAAA